MAAPSTRRMFAPRADTGFAGEMVVAPRSGEVGMPDWQGELEALLATLNVSLEGVPARASAQELAADASWGEDGAADAGLMDVVPVDGEEVSAVRSEIEATVGRVVALVRAGRMDRALRDDVIFVLDALTRPRPGDAPGSPAGGAGAAGVASRDSLDSQEWNLASAAAVLRFCRIVLRLTNTLARDGGL